MEKTMTRFVVFLALAAVLAVASAGAWATDFSAAKTTGLSSVWITGSGQDTARAVASGQWFYNFSLKNNTSNVSPLLDANGTSFVVTIDTLEFNNDDAVAATTSLGWSWQGKKTFVKTLVQNGDPRRVPASTGPGETETGFTLYFTSAQDDWAYLTHVYAAVPIPGAPNPPDWGSPTTYTGVSVTLSASESYVLQPGGPGDTWWDLANPSPDPHPHPVPEASTIFLGAIGMFGPLSYAWARRRAVR